MLVKDLPLGDNVKGRLKQIQNCKCSHCPVCVLTMIPIPPICL